MDSDNSDVEDQFAKQGGEAMDLNGDFNDSEDVDEAEEDDDVEAMGLTKQEKKDVKGEKLEN